MTRDRTTRLEAVEGDLDNSGRMLLMRRHVNGSGIALKCWGGGYAQRVDWDNEIRPVTGGLGQRSIFQPVLLARGRG